MKKLNTRKLYIGNQCLLMWLRPSVVTCEVLLLKPEYFLILRKYTFIWRIQLGFRWCVGEIIEEKNTT